MACAALAAGASAFAARVSPLAVRSILPMSSFDVRELYLSSLVDDPQRVLLTTRRANSTVRRGTADQAGNRYWAHRYVDPARPGIPPRWILSSRSRGGRLLVPAAALDLPEALFRGPASEDDDLAVRAALVQLYLDRLFQGLYLELRFPRRRETTGGEPERFDLVVVRDDLVRTVDFVLQPNARYYRAAIALGRRPEGPLRRTPHADGDELVFALFEDPERAAHPLFLPVPLFEELALAWGDQVPTIVDDRWHPRDVPVFEASAPGAAERMRLARLAAVHLAARIDGEGERERLGARVAALVEP
jgi:hypothetical protein